MKKFSRTWTNIIAFAIFTAIILTVLWTVRFSLPESNKMLTIQMTDNYKEITSQSIQLMYDNGNLQGYPFDGTHILTGEIKTINGKSSLVFKIPYSGTEKLRLNLLSVSELRVNSIYLGKEVLSPAQIFEKFSNLHSVKSYLENDTVVFQPIGIDPYIESLNFVNVETSYLQYVWLVVGLLFAGVLTKCFDWIVKTPSHPMALLVITFFSILFFPSVLYLSFPEIRTMPNMENRELAPAPNFSIDTVAQFPSAFDKYYNDHLPFRTALIQLHSAVKYSLFHSSPKESVILGKDSWLFYNSKEAQDGDEIADFLGTNHYSEEQYATLSNNLQGLEHYLSEKGIKLYVMYCPNKSAIYSEYMPSAYRKVSDISKVDLAVEYLRTNTNLNIIYPKQELKRNCSLLT